MKFLAEGAFNKVYTIVTSDDAGVESQLPYVFRTTLPVEPFYKTASEVATLSYIREHTSVPVPRVIAHSSTADNELGFEWILMDRIPGVSLKNLWREMDMKTKERVTRAVARYVKQLQDRCSFGVTGNLYFRGSIPDKTVRTAPVTDDRFVIGPIVTAFMFAGGRKLRLPRNLGPYSNDAEYMAALADAEAEDIKFLQSPEARTHDDFDEDLAEEASEIMEALRGLRGVLAVLFPSHRRSFALTHHDLSLSNILVDPTTYKINGIIDWECTGTRSGWEDRYPVFLEGREREEKPEPLSPGDDDEVRVEQWEDWEKTILRPLWDKELGDVGHGDDAVDKMRLEWRRQLDWLEIYAEKVMEWVEVEYEEWIFKMFEKSMDADVFTAIMRFIPRAACHTGIQTISLERLYNTVLQCFDHSTGHPQVISKFRDKAYLSAKALLYLAIQRKRIGDKSDEAFLKSISRRHLIMDSKSKGNSDLKSTLGVINRVFGSSEPVPWQNFSFTPPHHAWMARVLLYRAWDILRRGESLPDDIRGFILYSLRLEPTRPVSIVADCLFIIDLVLGIKPHTLGPLVVDKR